MRFPGLKPAGARAAAWFTSRRTSSVYRYGFAVITCLGAFLLTLVIPLLKEQSPGALMLTAVVLTALYAGLGPGLVATGVSLIIVDTFFVPPHPSHLLPTAIADLSRLGIFLMLAVLVSSLADKRRRAERKLRQREEHYRLLIENTTDIVTILDSDGVIRYESPSLKRVLGYETKELIGQPSFQFVHPEDLPQLSAVFRAAVAEPGTVTPAIELRFRAKDGSWRSLECVGKNLLHEPWVAGVVVHSRDITSRKQLLMEQAARIEAEGARRRFHDLVEGLDAIVWEAEADGRFTFVSRRAEQILGYAPELWVTGDGWLRHIFVEDRERVLDLLRHPADGANDCEYRGVTKSGRLLWLRLIVYAMRDDRGSVRQLRGLIVDVTERRQAEFALRSSERLAATGRLAASIAHEINNPMAAVTNLIYLIQNSPGLDESVRQYTRLAQEELSRMAHITRQMLGFYRESAKSVPVQITDLLDSVFELYARRIRNSGACIEKQYGLVPPVDIYPGEMRQVFSNLLLNALDAVGEGGRVRVHVYRSRDWRDPRRSGVRVVIADNGPGIRPEFQQRIFEPFFTTKGQKGTGLGLWVSQGIVQKHHGSIRVRSGNHPGRSGTCFSIFLPGGTPSTAQAAGSAA